MYIHELLQSSSSRSPTRPVQQQWWSWWSSSGPPSPPYNFWWSGVADDHCAIRSGWCLLHIWRTCSVVSSSSPQVHVGEGTILVLVSCACVRWACCGRNAVVPKPPGRACQEGGMHPSPVWVSALFWWWWSFSGNGCWLMVALIVLRIWLADLLARCHGFRSVLGSIGELLCMCCRVLAFVFERRLVCLESFKYR